MPGHRLGEQQAALDVLADASTTTRRARVVGLLFEDDERADDVQPGLDHRRELPREDLQRLRLDLGAERRLENAGFAFAAPADLPQRLGQLSLQAQLFARAREVRSDDLSGELSALGVDRRIGV